MKTTQKKSVELEQTTKTQASVTLDTLCRLCLTKCEELINIFDNDEKISLSIRIMACASLEIQQTDNLPKHICTNCRFQLEKSYVFRKRCKNSDTKIRRYLRLLNAGKISEIKDISDDDDEEFADSIEYINVKEREQQEKIEQEKLEREKLFEIEKKKMLKDEISRIQNEERQTIRNKAMKQIFAGIRKTTKKNKSEKKMDSGKIKKKVDKKFNHSKILNKLPTESNVKSVNLTDESPELDPVVIDNMLVETYSMVFDEEEEEKSLEQDYENSNIKSESRTYIINTNLGIDDEEEDDDVITVSVTNQENDEFTINTRSIKPDGENYEEEEEEYVVENIDDDDFDEKFDTEETYLEEEISSLEGHQVVDVDSTGTDEYDEITKAIKASLSNFSSKNVQLKMEKKNGNLTQVEMKTDDGNCIVLELPAINEEKSNEILDDNGEMKVFQCTECPSSFARRSQLSRHRSTHIKEKGFVCNFCEKWFPSNSSLQRHTRIHTGEKPYSCEICKRSFVQKEILKRHMMIHTGVKPFACDFCDKKFTQKEMLRQHVNRSHYEVPVVELHRCLLCDKSFFHASGLSRHLLIHTGRTFACEVCGKKFTDKSALKRHTTSMHNTVPTRSKTATSS